MYQPIMQIPPSHQQQTEEKMTDIQQTQTVLQNPTHSDSSIESTDPSLVETSNVTDTPSLIERYRASFLLAACGDALGYKHGSWEFCHSGWRIHQEMNQITRGLGVTAIRVGLPSFNLSDDTVMAIATAEGFLEGYKQLPAQARGTPTTAAAAVPPVPQAKADQQTEMAAAATPGEAPIPVTPATYTDTPLSFHQRCTLLAQAYVRSFDDMGGRAPGGTTGWSISTLERHGVHNWHRVIAFNKGHGGCGAAMRATPLGLVFPHANQIQDLIAYSVETGRMTHHSALGYLGALAGGLFTAYALQGVPPVEWGFRLMNLLPAVAAYLRHRGVEPEANIQSMERFETLWRQYLAKRNILDGVGPPIFPEVYGVQERDKFYVECSLNGWGGATGTDAPMIAYDAFLGANGSWEECCLRGILHGGDNDSTGVLIGGWYGAAYGFRGVPDCHHVSMEYHDRIVGLADALYARYHAGAGAHVGPIDSIQLVHIREDSDSSDDEEEEFITDRDSEEDEEQEDDVDEIAPSASAPVIFSASHATSAAQPTDDKSHGD